MDAAVASPEATALPASFRATPAANACGDDEFERAARLFAFTGEMPERRAKVKVAPMATASVLAPPARRLSGRAIAARLVAASASVGVMGVVGLLAFGTAAPAAVATTTATADIHVVADGPVADEEGIQAFVTSSDTPTVTLDRTESYSVTSLSEIAAESGVTQFANTWVNDPNWEVQWPFPVGVPISATYGSTSYLALFSTPHRGVDFTPGAGAEIHAVAAGTVRIATQAGGDYGVTVVIDHVIDGEKVSTRYAHMQYGSLRVAEGDTVEVGDVIGTVGSTGRSTGAHLHLEVLLDGSTHTDPVAWIKEHTGT
ncbi:M23 family metallopeptidase [Microbacterium sp.]|uniref:M23 family metallopeptidase n=1 Tax=Microbacterium sp. TaxID=51671 RepID=UPI003A846250